MMMQLRVDGRTTYGYDNHISLLKRSGLILIEGNETPVNTYHTLLPTASCAYNEGQNVPWHAPPNEPVAHGFFQDIDAMQAVAVIRRVAYVHASTAGRHVWGKHLSPVGFDRVHCGPTSMLTALLLCL